MGLSDYLDWPEWRIEQVAISANAVLITAMSVTSNNVCPNCGQPSTRVHSYYQRQPADLPISAKTVKIHLTVRRFRCLNDRCPKVTFSERTAKFLPVYARRTNRLTHLINQIGLALGGQASARLLPHLKVSFSRDTILRILRGEFVQETDASARVVGIDDWAKRKGMSYGAIVVDLESGAVLDLLPDRSPEVIAVWLKQHPSIEIVSRDRSKQIIEGLAQGASQAIQVADRFHLLQNLTDTVYKVVEKKQKIIKNVFKTEKKASASCDYEIKSNDLQPTPADLRRWERIKQAHHLAETGWTSIAIAVELGLHPKTVRRYLRISDLQPLNRRKRPKLLDPYKSYLIQRWNDGCRKGTLLYDEIKGQGYAGRMTPLRDFLRTLKGKDLTNQKEPSDFDTKWRRLSLRRLAFAMGRPAEVWQEKEWLIAGLNLLGERDAMLGETIDLARRFTCLVSNREADQLDTWLSLAKSAKAPPLRQFAVGLEADLPAIRAALQLKWSNGPVEGKINRLKMLKRQMYGRANLDLLRIRLVGAQSA